MVGFSIGLFVGLFIGFGFFIVEFVWFFFVSGLLFLGDDDFDDEVIGFVFVFIVGEEEDEV